MRPNNVVMHPLVLLSVVDHYNRVVAKNKNRRVVGALLGSIFVFKTIRGMEWHNIRCNKLLCPSF